jgi:hypothetical protein
VPQTRKPALRTRAGSTAIPTTERIVLFPNFIFYLSFSVPSAIGIGKQDGPATVLYAILAITICSFVAETTIRKKGEASFKISVFAKTYAGYGPEWKAISVGKKTELFLSGPHLEVKEWTGVGLHDFQVFQDEPQ